MVGPESKKNVKLTIPLQEKGSKICAIHPCNCFALPPSMSVLQISEHLPGGSEHNGLSSGETDSPPRIRDRYSITGQMLPISFDNPTSLVPVAQGRNTILPSGPVDPFRSASTYDPGG